MVNISQEPGWVETGFGYTRVFYWVGGLFYQVEMESVPPFWHVHVGFGYDFS